MFRSFEVITGAIFLIYGGGAIAVAMVHAISWYLQAVGGLLIMHRHLLKIWFNWLWDNLKNILYDGLPICLASIMLMWLQSGPLVLYRHSSGSENELGQLALVMQAFIVLINIPIAAGTSSIPILSRSVERNDGKDILYLDTMIRAAFILGAAAGLCGLGIGPWIVKILFGVRYNEAGRLLGLVMWLLIPYTCGMALNVVYFAQGQYKLPAICAGLGALVLSCIFPWLVGVMNTSGAIIATGIGMWVWVLSLIWKFARSGNLDVYHTVFRPLIIIIFCLGIFFGLKPVSSLLAMLSSWTALLCGTLIFGVLTGEERYLLASLKRRLCS
jgi:O-antigen/teichoic acid export membrane protein